MYTRPRRFFRLKLVLFWMFMAPVAMGASHPNVVVFLSDDQGWGDLSINGNSNLSTPQIDSLARDGARFDRFYVCPVCSPTRAEFLTGRYHPRGGVFNVTAGGERLNLQERTLADAFQAAGYRTAAFGKWHNGMQFPYHPNARGFEEFYGFCSGHWGHYFDHMLDHNGQVVQGEGFIIDDLTNHALQFIDEHKAEPFFVYLPYNTPHSPMQVPDEWWDRFKEKELTLLATEPKSEDIPHTRAALAMCENIDWNVGRVLQKLQELQLSENTIVLYFCDNGPNGFRWNGGMKGRKGTTDEGGVRSPLHVRWPGKIAPGTEVRQIAAAIDLLPTLLDLCEVPQVGELPVDGRSLKPLLLGGANDWPDRLLFSTWARKVSVRNQGFRLDAQGKLFDMQSDPGQTRDVSLQHPDLTASLKQAAADFQRDVLRDFDKQTKPFTVGHAASSITQLPVRDALSQGGIVRSSRHPNSSYFGNWKSVDDRITWDIEVLTPGDYLVELFYTCPVADVGSTIELSWQEQKLVGRVDAPHDPPLLGDKDDRVPRGEGYVKDFHPLRLGTLPLTVGQGTLTLRALEIPGSQVMDLRMLVLTRQD